MVAVSLPARPAAAGSLSPPALRGRRPSWRDPRLAVGVLLVVGSVLVGARVLAGADDTVPVLAAREPLAAGQRLEQGDLETVRLRFDSEADADRYLPGDASVPEGGVLLRAVGAGELLPRTALDAAGARPLSELPLSVDPGRVPAGVRAGSVVDVWVAPAVEGETEPEQLLEEAPVLAASRAGATGPGGMRQVVVGVPVDAEPQLARVVARLGGDAALVVVRRPG
jgi:Flp pilus assembly protein CpaB